jgi:hypothetical protein
MDWEEFDAEMMERKKIAKELCDLASVADLKHLQVAYNLLKQLEDSK